MEITLREPDHGLRHRSSMMIIWIMVLLLDFACIILMGLAIGYATDKSMRQLRGNSWLYITIYVWSAVQSIYALFVLCYYHYLAQYLQPAYHFSMRMLVLIPVVITTTISMFVFGARMLARGDYNAIMVVSLLSTIAPLHTIMVGLHMHHRHRTQYW